MRFHAKILQYKTENLVGLFLYLYPYSSLYNIAKVIVFMTLVNPVALKTAKTQWSFGCSEFNRIKGVLVHLPCFPAIFAKGINFCDFMFSGF